MKKNYNYWVTPQSTPQFKLKRILHILSSTCLVVNLIVFAILLPEIRLWTLGIAFVFTAYLFLQLFVFHIWPPRYSYVYFNRFL